MPRRIVFGFGLWLSAAGWCLGLVTLATPSLTANTATAMTIAAIVLPRWESVSLPHSRRSYCSHVCCQGSPIHYSYGLHKRCSSVTGSCNDFPQYEDCLGDNKAFCAMWRTTGFLMSLAVIIECATLVAYLTVIFGGKQSREQGWKVVCTLLGLCTLIQVAAMAIVVCLNECASGNFVGN